MGALEYLEESIKYGLLWPKYDEQGRPTNIFFISFPVHFALGYVSYKGGLKYFAKEGFLSPSKAKNFIKKNNKHNLWNGMSVSEELRDKGPYKARKAKIWVKSTSGRDEQYYQIGLKDMPHAFEDDEKGIITSLSRLGIRHIRIECGIVDNSHDYILSQKLVERWLKDGYRGNLRIHLLCSHMWDAWLKVANNPYRVCAMDYFGLFKEENIEENTSSFFRRIDEGIFKMSTLNRLIFPELFEETGLMKLINTDLYENLVEH